MNGREIIDIEFNCKLTASLGKIIELFEQFIKTFSIAGNVMVTNTGKASILHALMAAGLREDVVLIYRYFTFAESVKPIRYHCALPVFLDNKPETRDIDPAVLKSAVLAWKKGDLKFYSNLEELKFPTQLPIVKIPFHLLKRHAKTQKITGSTNKHGMKVIQDSPEALGSIYKKIYCGLLNEYDIFSSIENKSITANCVGPLLSNDRNAKVKIKNLAFHNKNNFVACKNNKVGYNYRLSNILAGIGITKIEVIQESITKRKAIFSLNKNFLNENPSIMYLAHSKDNYQNPLLTSTLIDLSKKQGICKEKLINHLS